MLAADVGIPRHGEGVLEALPPLRRPHPVERPRLLRAHECLLQGQPLPFQPCSEDQLHLVEAALAIACFMQGDRYRHVDSSGQHEIAFAQEGRDARQRTALLLVLERMDQAAQAAVIAAERPRRPDQRLHGRRQQDDMRLLRRRHAIRTPRAEVLDIGVADGAMRRKDKVHEHLPESPAHRDSPFPCRPKSNVPSRHRSSASQRPKKRCFGFLLSQAITASRTEPPMQRALSEIV